MRSTVPVRKCATCTPILRTLPECLAAAQFLSDIINYLILNSFFLRPGFRSGIKIAEFASKPESAGSQPKRQPPNRFKPANASRDTPSQPRIQDPVSSASLAPAPGRSAPFASRDAAIATPNASRQTSARQHFGDPAGKTARTRQPRLSASQREDPASDRHAPSSSRSSTTPGPEQPASRTRAAARKKKGGADGTAFSLFRDKKRVRPAPACPSRPPVPAFFSAASRRRALQSGGCVRG